MTPTPSGCSRRPLRGSKSRRRRCRGPYAVFNEAQRLLYEAPFLAERTSLEAMIAGHEDALHPATRAILASAQDWTARDTYRAIHRLAELKRDARRVLADTDVFVVPTTPTIYRVAEVEAEPILLNARLGTYTNFVNLMGLCGIAVPSGFRGDGLPLGITVLAEPSPRPGRPPSPAPSTARPGSRSARPALRTRGEAHEDPDRFGRWRHVHRQHRLRSGVPAHQRFQGADHAAGARVGTVESLRRR